MFLYIYPPNAVTVSVPPIAFTVDGVSTTVNIDTGDSTQSTPLPVINLDASGNPASPLTDTELRASPVAVSGTVTANTGLTQPLTDTQLRAVAVPISAASLPLPTGASTEAKQDAASVLFGAVTETAPASDTASSGLNGRLQRIAQRITSLIALFPGSLGQKTMANSFAVTLASDQSALSVAQSALTPTFQEDLTVSTTPETFTAPAGARWVKIQAPSSNTVNLRVKIGAVASSTSGIVFEPGRSEDYFVAGNVSYCSESTSGQAIMAQFGA